jgi:hypothetical protein
MGISIEAPEAIGLSAETILAGIKGAARSGRRRPGSEPGRKATPCGSVTGNGTLGRLLTDRGI